MARISRTTPPTPVRTPRFACRAPLRACAALLVSFLAACGGGGGSGAPPTPTTISLEFGTVSSTAPTRATVTIVNPRTHATTAIPGATTGPFALDAADLPAPIPALGSLVVGVVFTPTTTGAATGDVLVTLDDGSGDTDEIRVAVTASAEPVSLVLAPTSLAFGEVVPGTLRALDLHVTNTSLASVAPLGSLGLPAGGFTLVSPSLPTSLAPGAEVVLSIRYEPTAVGAFGGSASLAGWSPSESISIPVSATTGGPVVTTFAAQTLDASLRTPTLSVDVPADAISLSLEGVMPAGNVVGLAEWTGPSGKVYENTSGTGSYVWIPGDEVFSPTLPDTDKPTVQLEPGGGTYTFRLYRLSGTGTTMDVRAIVERRPGDTGHVGVIDLDVWLANVLTPKASTAPTDTKLQTILQTIDSILDPSGIRIGNVRYHDVTDATYDDVTEAEFPGLLRLTSTQSDPRLNLFFVRTALGGGVLGVSSTIAGPRKNGTGLSGVMSLYDGGYSAAFIGLVAAHEIGHYIGLYHPAEQDGSHDFVDDTLECPATGTNGTCAVAGGGYLMHWQAVGGTTITPGQTHVILGHPCVDADVPPVLPAVSAASFVRRRAAATAGELEASPSTWCATCARCRPKGR